MNTLLNYHHFYYFWVIAQEGSIAAASKKLRLAQPTLSTQLKQLEDSLQVNLFERKNRQLVLTDSGRTALEYANEIFSLGREFLATLQGWHPSSRPTISIGVIDVFPKLLTYKVLEPLTNSGLDVLICCIEGKRRDLLTQLATHELDIVLSDAPVPSDMLIQAFSHHLGDSGTLVCGTRAMALKARKKFPTSLADFPLILPTRNTMFRREIDTWMEKVGIMPNIKAEVEDSALMKVFAQHKTGLVFLPETIAKEATKSFELTPVGALPEIRENYYLISLEKKLKNPLATLVSDNAHERLFQ
ncbi:MAG: LysR family transcriptional regulator [Bdellovibrionales bacterium]|nr:LysR family transcriptional regulator [Bdellovibrionales bacterium]